MERFFHTSLKTKQYMARISSVSSQSNFRFGQPNVLSYCNEDNGKVTSRGRNLNSVQKQLPLYYG